MRESDWPEAGLRGRGGRLHYAAFKAAGIMTFPSTVDLDARIYAAIAPLFATDMMLRDGHTGASLNATVTFVRRGGQIFALTCHHVLAAFRFEGLKRSQILAPSVHSGRSVIQFKTFVGKSIRWTFRSCRDFPDHSIMKDEDALNDFDRANSSRPDIAIADVPEEIWAMFRKDRPMEPIDLDDWIEPPWEQLERLWAAFGFPNGQKYGAGHKVAAPMTRITAELQSSSPQQREVFTLFSRLDREHGYGFSGISGGPVLTESDADKRFYFAGIVFEGTPSSAESEDDDESFLGQTDIYLRCYTLTPENFDRWRNALKFGVEFQL